MFVHGKDFIRYLDTLVPRRYAVADDPIGLQVGDAEVPVRGVMIVLDLDEAALQKAQQRDANWILVHHAPIYRPLPSLAFRHPSGRLLAQAISQKLQVFVLHTNLDAVAWGINEVLAERLQLQQTRPLLPVKETLYKLAVYVPQENLTQVQDAIFAAGAGQIGAYSGCSFTTLGEGSFLPGEGTNPAIGEPGKREVVKEYKLETIVPAHAWGAVREAMLRSHPYEEVAYDLYLLQNEVHKAGMGRVGQLTAPSSLLGLAKKVQQAYNLSHLRYVGDPQQRVHRVALLGGSGGKIWQKAQEAQADVYITGDLDHHTVLEARAAGMAMIDPGHFVEDLGLPALAERLQGAFPDLPIFCEKAQNPFQILT